MKKFKLGLILPITLIFAVVVGQLCSYLLSPGAWQSFAQRVPGILSMITFWGPIIALVATLVIWCVLRLLGFKSLEMIRVESLEQNNPVPAIIFSGTLVAVMLFLLIVVRP